MDISRGRLNKAAILQIPEHERQLFLSIAHLQNEISILLRAVFWSYYNISSENEAEAHGQISTSFFFVKILAGKLNEGWTLLEKVFFSDRVLSRDFCSTATPPQVEALDALKKHFGQTSILRDVRTNFAFHYSPPELDAVLATVPDELDLYIEHDGSANTLYYFAEVLANHAVLKRIDPADSGAAMKRLYDETVTVAKQFTRFGQAFMSYVIKRQSPSIWKDTAIPVSFDKLPSFSEVRFPWFTDTTAGLSNKKGTK